MPKKRINGSSSLESQLIFTYPENIRFRCSKCALCCGDTKEKQRKILLLESDVKRISNYIGKDTGDFTKIISGREPYAYLMKKDNGGRCIFLEEKNCSIYTNRPLVCKFYPFELINLGAYRYSFICTKECPAVGTGPILKKTFYTKLVNQAEKSLRTNPLECK